MTLNSAEQRQRIKEQSKKVADYLQQMTQEHPITPPPELVEQWLESTRSNDCIGAYPANYEQLICTAAARWGADQQLLACGKYLEQCAAWEEEDVTEMYNYLRPKPPSLKEQALQALYRFDDTKGHDGLTQEQIAEDFVLIRRALESLPDQ